MVRRTIGIDLAIRGDHVARLFDDGHPVGRPLRFRLTSAALTGFVGRVTAGLPQGATITAVMEPTGMSWFPVAHWLRRAGIAVIRVKGQRVKALRKYLSEHTKTDAADAYVLGAMPSFGSVALDPVYVPSAERHALQRLTKQRHRLDTMVCASKRRLIDLIRWACPALEAVLPDLRTSLALALLDRYFDPHQVRRARRATLVRFVGEHASGNHPHSGPFVEALVDGLRVAAEETIILHGDAVDFTLLQAEVGFEVAQVRLVEAQLKELDRRIEALYRALHPSDVLRSIPGIGERLAPLVLGVLHDQARFGNERHIRGFCGLFPTTSESGGAERPRQRITQAGNDRMKRALFLAADTARHIDPDLAAVYWRLMVGRGHHHKQALCAVATRLVNRINMVLRTGRAYELRDREGRAITVAEGKAIVSEHFRVPDQIRRARRRNPTPIAA
jgi:transposase